MDETETWANAIAELVVQIYAIHELENPKEPLTP